MNYSTQAKGTFVNEPNNQGNQDLNTNPGGGAGSSAGSSNPVDISDDTLVRVPGQSEPVKYGELSKRLQADYTKKSQEVGALRKTFDSERQTWEQTRTQQETYLKTLAAQLLAAKQGGSKQNNPLDAIRNLDYIDGKTAAQLVETIQSQGIGPVVKAIEQRDEVIKLLYQKVQDIQKSIGSLQGDRTNQGFENKVSGWMKSRDLSDDMRTFVKELYMAYEGDDLDEEFGKDGGILDQRLTQLEKFHQTRQQARVQANRQAPFKLPGKGGNGMPGSKAGFSGRESAKDMADVLFESIRSRSDNT